MTVAVSVVIPAYNEGSAIVPVLDRIFAAIQSPCEVLVVVDFPQDSTVPVVEEYSAREPRLRAVVNTYGRGPANAIRYGIDQAAHPVAVVTMADGSDAVSDWPLLNALLNTAGGATWVSLHHGGGVGIGYSQHAGVVIVCDGTREAAKRIERVLWNDPASGVMRHADAGYSTAMDVAKANSLDLPMLGR